VNVFGLEGRSAKERQAAIVRVVGALREFDRNARSIDVAIGRPSA
jgi:transcription elongation GreA/GreB family factor